MKKFEKIIRLALKEDISTGDITTNIFVPAKNKFKGILVAKEDGTLCGINIAKRTFQIVDSAAKFKIYANDGSFISKGQKLMSVEGSRKILTAERTAINFVQRLSGIATFTSKFVKKLNKSKTYIYDTRKTTPALRVFEKYAVKCGGGKNHRMGLYDAFLIKDNHIAALGSNPYPALKKKINFIRKRYKSYKVEIEAKTIRQVEKFIALDVDIIMLDNMSFGQMKKAIKIIRSAVARQATGGRGQAATGDRRQAIGNKQQATGRTPEIEISGNVGISSLRKLLKLSPERISAGSLTHSAKSLDISFNIV
ncbi:MAG: carboxylating nicotinate-nucleotide diphosphorylase [Elusimicrobia bacterium]|nr:carboxylating nicotinate-nucleotide diphosphorylase [Elusimicrobiota bacterium]